MYRRGISEDDVRTVLSTPDQILPGHDGRTTYQKRVLVGEPARSYLLRAIVETRSEPPAVVTAYRTSRIEKYSKETP